MSVSRRRFTAALAASPIALAQQSAPPQRRGTAPETTPFEETLSFARNSVAPRVEPFAMTQVRVLAGPFADAAEWNRGYMSRLPADRLVRNFRVNAGLATSAEPFGGWERPNNGQPLDRGSELRGHFTGHFLSASAQLYASTGDRAAKAKADEIVAELAECQRKLGGTYLSAFPTEFFDRLDARQEVWAPFYTIHKIMAGMFDMHTLTGNTQALDVVTRMADWADHWTAQKSEAHMQQILETEYGGMNEVLYNLAALTGEDRWARAGDRFTKKRFFNPLALHRDELRGLHVNTHIPQVIGAARRYEISGDTRFHDVADYFWYEVTRARSYATSGTSNGEGWLTSPRHLAEELPRSNATEECCCSYNMLKLTRHLYQWTADPRYFDYYERSLLNMRLGTIHPDSGATQYYLSLAPGAWKTFSTEFNSFWCCTGTGVEEYSKLNNSIYWRDDRGVFVNLFIGSELNWSEKNVRLRQETNFPQSPETTLHVQAAAPTRLTLRIRIPEWSADTQVKLNGQTLDASASPGSYLTLIRDWKDDRIDVRFTMRLRAQPLPDDLRQQAFLFGPLVLAGDLGAGGLTDAITFGPNVPPLRQAPPLEIPPLHPSGADLASWIKPGDAPLEFRAAGIAFRPINQIFGRRYNVYWRVS